MKMGSNGEELWAKTFGSAINAEGLITFIEINTNGDIVIGGEAKYAWDFAGQQVTFNTYGSAFMAAFEADGSEKWLLDLGNIPTLHYLAKFKNNKLLSIYDEKQVPDYSEYYRRRIVNEDGSLGPILSTLKTWSPESPAQNGTYENTFAYDSDSGIYYWSFYRISTSLVINDNDTLRAYLNNTNGFYLLKLDTNLNILDSFKALNGKRRPAPIAVLPGKGFCIQTEVFGALYFDSTSVEIPNGADYAYMMMEFDQDFNLLDTFIVMSDRFDYFFNKGLAYMPNGDIVTQYASEEDITFGDTFFNSANRSWTHMTVLGIHKGYYGEEDDDITYASRDLKDEAITLFPNPAKDFISLKMKNNKEILDYSIISMNGKQIANGQFKGSNYQIDISNLNVGMYLLQLRDSSGHESHKKFMVSH